jgi:hypothetical protein
VSSLYRIFYSFNINILKYIYRQEVNKINQSPFLYDSIKKNHTSIFIQKIMYMIQTVEMYKQQKNTRRNVRMRNMQQH